ncbi:MAG: hypothetical protein PVI21_05460 [Candidatus Woesebacteria bacterium]
MKEYRVSTGSSFGSRVIKFTFLLSFFGAIIWFALNWQIVLDWWRIQIYPPSAQIVQIADSTGMSSRGRELWYASTPVVESAAAFNQDCQNNSEESIVLGCYKLQKIYLFDVTDEKLSGVEEVTGAHEMLHAAYERLSKAEREEIDQLINAQMSVTTDERLLELISLYNKTEPGEIYNEMHSIFGAEYRDLSPELESYYKTYFDDRNKVVTLAESYENVFTESENRIAQMDEQLTNFKSQIDKNNATLDSEYAIIQSESARLNDLWQKQKVDEYNAAVPVYNARIRAYNALVEETQNLIDKHNSLVIERNNEATAQNKLNQSLDSKYNEVNQT